MGWNVFISANIGYYVWKWELERVARIDGRRESIAKEGEERE
jgi:hypothetical protein